MRRRYPYTISSIHTNDRFPGQIYAEVHDEEGKLICAATLAYCYERVIGMIKEGWKVVCLVCGNLTEDCECDREDFMDCDPVSDDIRETDYDGDGI